MRLYEFLAIIEDETKLIDFLVQYRVIRDKMTCPHCGSSTTFSRERLLLECYNVRYETKGKKKRRRLWCNFRKSALHKTWFSNGNLSLQKSCRFIAYFLMIRPPRQSFLEVELNMSPNTVVDWSNFCRELCIQWVDKISEQIGGEGCIVEVDEAKIGKRKYNKGRLVNGQWIFGGFERNTKKLFIESVPNRSAETLLEVIKQWIKPGTTIISDCWKAYNCLENNEYKHLTVNHKYNFVDPETKAHTQNIERAWRDTRGAIPRYGTRTEHYEGYIAEFLFKRKFIFDERIHAFFTIMADIYPI